MNADDPRVIDAILAGTSGIDVKVSRLFAVAMANYRLPLGDKAWAEIRRLIGDDATNALAFCTGAASVVGAAATAPGRAGRWENLIPELSQP